METLTFLTFLEISFLEVRQSNSYNIIEFYQMSCQISLDGIITLAKSTLKKKKRT